MECTEALILMSQRLDAPLERIDEAALQEHLHQCASCRRVSRMFAELDTVLEAEASALPSRGLSSRVMARVVRRARVDRTVRHALITLLSLALVVVGLVLPAVRAVQTANQSELLSAVVTQVGDEVVGVARVLAAPLVTVVRTVLMNDGYPYLLAWLLLAVVLVLAWVSVISRVIRPARPEIPINATTHHEHRRG